MKRKLLAAGVAAITLGAVAAACGDAGRAPVAPRDGAPPSTPSLAAAKAPAKVKVGGMQWRKALKDDLSASALIGPAGGVLALPATGLRLVVPAGAVAAPTQFRATAIAGKLVAYDFEPAGSRFPVPLRVEQDTAHVAMKRVDRTRALAGYFPSRQDLDQAATTGSVAELIPITWTGGTIAFSVSHFSGYIMSWGFDEAERGQ